MELLLLLFLLLAGCSVQGKTLEAVLDEAQSIVVEMADDISNTYSKRCESYASCANANYDECRSDLPKQTCPANGVTDSACGISQGGNRLFDWTVSTVRLPSSIVTSDRRPRVTAASDVCYTKSLDTFFVATYQNLVNSGDYGDFLPKLQMYVGTDAGAFRIFPGRTSDLCESYDPRRRPWYVAASSGPKDVILVLDVSGSMYSAGRDKRMIAAAKQVVETLTIADFFSIVLFSSTATYLRGFENGYMKQASKVNMVAAIAELTKISFVGGTNFDAGFNMAFNVLDNSVRLEYTSNCHRLILFLTDGAMNEGGTEQEVMLRIANRNVKHNAFILTYTLGAAAEKSIPKRIACSSKGIFAHIEDGGDLATEMSGYYQLLSLGLGNKMNRGFAAWIEPYARATDGLMSTGVSAPIFDRSTSPPYFIGVAAMDILTQFLEMKAAMSSQAVLQKLIDRSRAKCPTLDLNACMLQALRRSLGDEESVCPDGEGGGCDGNSNIAVSASCPKDPPTDVWNNTKGEGKSFVERACCGPPGTLDPARQQLEPWVIVVIAVSVSAVVIVAILVASVWYLKCFRPQKRVVAKGEVVGVVMETGV